MIAKSSFAKKTSVFAVLLLFVLLVCSNAVLGYNRHDAAEYARYFHDKVVSDGIYWIGKWVEGEKVDSIALDFLPGTSVHIPENYLEIKEPGDYYSLDCAHFVSSAIGSPPSFKGYSGGGLDVPDRADGYGEPGAHKLIEWAIEDVGEEVDSVEDLLKGDIIGYDLSQNGHIDHVAIYLGSKKAAAHSESWKGHWHLGYSPSDFDPTFVHITEEVEPDIPWKPLVGIGATLAALLAWFLLS